MKSKKVRTAAAAATNGDKRISAAGPGMNGGDLLHPFVNGQYFILKGADISTSILKTRSYPYPDLLLMTTAIRS
jgi:hypothetical protein